MIFSCVLSTCCSKERDLEGLRFSAFIIVGCSFGQKSGKNVIVNFSSEVVKSKN